MNVTLYAQAYASELKPGSVLLDVPEHDREHPEIPKLPVAYLVDEIRDQLGARQVYGRPLERHTGKRRVWSFSPDDVVDVELDPTVALRTLDQVKRVGGGFDLRTVLGPGGTELAELQAEASTDE